MTLLAWTLSLAAALPALQALPADPRICQLVLHEEEIERDDLELGLRTARSEKSAAQRIYLLVHALWEKEAIEEIVYLRALHDRDATEADHDRARHLLRRQEALLEQYRRICADLSGRSGDPAAARRAARQALEEYRQADCEALDAARRSAAADLAFSQSWLESVQDLRRNDVATAQDVIRAERDVEVARESMEQYGLRVESCRAEAGGAGSGG